MFQLQRILAEGTTEPFVARFWVGISELKDNAVNLQGGSIEERRREFDRLYRPVLEELQACREAARDVVSLLADHRSKLADGSIVERQEHAVTFTENINRPLHQATTRLLVSGVIALDRTQYITAFFGLQIGSFFQRTAGFEQGMQELRTRGHGAFELYLRVARARWAEQFREQRVAFEHGGWTVPELKYVVGPEAIAVQEPTVCGLSVSVFAPLTVRRLLAFAETVIVYALKGALAERPHGLATVVEIPVERRDPSNPTRFRFLPPNSPYSEWLPRYDDNDFLSGIAARPTQVA